MVTIFDLEKIYKTYFGNAPYYLPTKDSENPKTENIFYGRIDKNPRPKGTIVYTKYQMPLNKVGLYGQDIWHPITLWESSEKNIEIEACTVRVNTTKHIIKTEVSERKGTVKEQFNIGDYKFTIKGFLIGKNKQFPENEIVLLKELFESDKPIGLFGGYPELFLDSSNHVAIDTLEFPEVEGKSPWIRPFSLTCESDFIQDLTIQ